MKKTASLEKGKSFFKHDNESLRITYLSSNDTNIQIINAMPPNNTGWETLKNKTHQQCLKPEKFIPTNFTLKSPKINMNLLPRLSHLNIRVMSLVDQYSEEIRVLL